MSDVRTIFEALAAVTPLVREEFRTARGKTASKNPSGDVQLDADRRMDRRFYNQLAPLDAVGAFASEEREAVEDVGEGLSVAIDPLDGSSNLRSNNIIGTVVGVYDGPLPASGADLVASAFFLYGPLTTMTTAVNGEATRHVIENGEIIAYDPVVFPDTSQICGFAGAMNEWSEPTQTFWKRLNHEYKLRYTGAMVGDIDHLLIEGGLLGYPERTSNPDGDLRLQYEVNPIAYLIEAAGGCSSTGHGPILDTPPEGLHQHAPAYFGNAALISDLEDHVEKS